MNSLLNPRSFKDSLRISAIETLTLQVKSLEVHDDETIPVPSSDGTIVVQTAPEREISSVSNGSAASSNMSHSQIQMQNEIKIAPNSGIRIAPQERNSKRWTPSKEMPKATGRPVFCPPGSSIVVNQRISQSGSCFTFFPEG